MSWFELVIVVRIAAWLCLLILSGLQGPVCCYPVEAVLQNEMNQIQKSLVDHMAKTGGCPTTLPEMRAQLEIPLTPTSLLATGRDCWGRELVVLPIAGKPHCYSLRSLGKDGLLQLQNGDDLETCFRGGTAEELGNRPESHIFPQSPVAFEGSDLSPTVLTENTR